MATLSTPRQPFGVLGESKLRNLQSIKNRQNGELAQPSSKTISNETAITPSSTSSLKRRAASPELSDSENIDPSYFDSSKRKRAAIEDDVSLSKPRFTTKIVPSSVSSTKLATPMFTAAQKTTTPYSAPAAAGRSPTKLSRKLDRSVPRRRFLPPSVGASPSLSISAALRGTLGNKRPKRKIASLEQSKPKSWFFEIYEESEAQQDYNVKEWGMTQSSANLDISDSEGEGLAKGEDKGKENVDPTGAVPEPVVRSNSPVVEQDENAMLAEGSRTPLGDLDVSEYFGEGLDATSVVLVGDDAGEIEKETEAETVAEAEVTAVPAEKFTFEAPAIVQSIPEWAKTACVEEVPAAEEQVDDAMPTGFGGDIDIWESESAKDENEVVVFEDQQQCNVVVVEAGQTISLTRSCLQEV